MSSRASESSLLVQSVPFALVFEEGELSGTTWPLEAVETKIGRAPGLHIVMRDDCVSQHHASFVRSGERVYVRDMGSRNGVFVNGEQVDAAWLRDGARIQIGRSVASLRASCSDEDDGSSIRRRGPSAALERACLRARREGYPLSVVMIHVSQRDSDGRVTRELMNELARTMRGVLRAEDGCTLDGDNLVVTCPRVLRDRAIAIAERLARHAARARLVHAPEGLRVVWACVGGDGGELPSPQALLGAGRHGIVRARQSTSRAPRARP